jgi:hypothetical protein
MADMHKVRHHLDAQAEAHRKARREAALAAARERLEQNTAGAVSVPQDGLQGADEGWWAVGDE